MIDKYIANTSNHVVVVECLCLGVTPSDCGTWFGYKCRYTALSSDVMMLVAKFYWRWPSQKQQHFVHTHRQFATSNGQARRIQYIECQLYLTEHGHHSICLYRAGSSRSTTVGPTADTGPSRQLLASNVIPARFTSTGKVLHW